MKSVSMSSSNRVRAWERAELTPAGLRRSGTRKPSASLVATGAQIDSFLVATGLTKQPVPLTQVLAGQFTQEYATRQATTSSAGRPAA